MRWILSILFFSVLASVQAQDKDVNFYMCKWGPAFELEMPNIFTPNSDFKNDQFVPLVKNEICIEHYRMRIFNRWGQQLFESRVYSVGWDGMTIYGYAYPEGTYYYLVDYQYLAQQGNETVERSLEQKGYFLLTR